MYLGLSIVALFEIVELVVDVFRVTGKTMIGHNRTDNIGNKKPNVKQRQTPTPAKTIHMDGALCE